jgi:hypothetical protein
MAVSTDMIRTWRQPRVVMRSLLAMGQREDRAIAYLMAACVIAIIAQLPMIARWNAGFDVPTGTEQMEMGTRVQYAVMSWLMIAPLMMYAVAAILHIIAKVFGGKGTWFSARLALFWSFLSTTPALLLYGLAYGFIGNGPQANLVGFIWFAAFAIIGFLCLREAEKAPV